MTTRFEVYDCIKKGINREQAIADELGTSKDAVRKHIERLMIDKKVEGIGVTSNRYFKITSSDSLGVSEAAKPLIVTSMGISEDVTVTPKPSQALWRPHRIKLEAWHTSYNPKQLEQQGFIRMEEKDRPNITYYQKEQSGYKLQLYTHALFLIAPLPPSTPENEASAQRLKEKYEQDAYIALGNLITQYGINLTQIEGKTIIVVNFEIANTPSEFAKNILEGRSPTYIVLVWDRLTGDARVIADQSILHELEGILAKHSGWDSDMLKAFKDDIQQDGLAKMYQELGIQGARGLLADVVHPSDGWTLYKARLAASEERLDKVDKTLILVANNEATHVPFFQSQTALNNKMIERLEKLEQQPKLGFWASLKKRLVG